jgi:hypothetical protein
MTLHPDYPVVEGQLRVTETWSVELPEAFNRRVEEGALCMWRPGLTIWVEAWKPPLPQTTEQMAEWLRDGIAEEATDLSETAHDLVRITYRLSEAAEDERAPALYGYAIGRSGYLQIAAYFDDEADAVVARQIFESASEAGTPPAAGETSPASGGLDGARLTFTGPPIDDTQLLDRLPDELAALLTETNGFIAFGGALHVRGACASPSWHSLRDAWDGPSAIHALYEAVEPDDIPFAQDCVGDQFVLRAGEVHRLNGETGELVSLSRSFTGFLDDVMATPDEVLQPTPLVQLEQEGASLEPGNLILAYPPYCAEQSAQGVALSQIPASELLAFHADLARQIAEVGDSGSLRFEITD